VIDATSDRDNGHTPSYDFGFESGAKSAKEAQGRQLSSAELKFVAHGEYVKIRKLVTLKCEDFEAGWKAGYLAYFEGIV
jgi:hypothetical protein